ncbi:MAG: hypothetical protein ACRC7S_06250 [Cetobacterium sp.]
MEKGFKEKIVITLGGKQVNRTADNTLNEMLNLTRNNYTQISNKILLDKNLSFGAKGLLCLMLSRPDGWQFYNWELAKKSNDTEYAVKKLIKELTEAKYLYRLRKANKGKGKGFRWIWIFKDEPLTDEEIEKVKSFYNPNKMEVSNYTSDSTISLNNDDSSMMRYSNTDSFSNTNSFSNTKNNHDKTLDVFEDLFKKFEGINFTKTNQASVKKLLKTMSEKNVIDYLIETYEELKKARGIKSIASAFSAKIKKGDRQVNTKPKVESIDNPIISTEGKKLTAKEKANYIKTILSDEKLEELMEEAKQVLITTGISLSENRTLLTEYESLLVQEYNKKSKKQG